MVGYFGIVYPFRTQCRLQAGCTSSSELSEMGTDVQWFIVCYALAIYMLNLFLAFLQPRFDPSLADDLAADEVEEGAPGLPGSEPKSSGGFKGLMSGFGNGGEDEEFRPFIRRLPGLSILFCVEDSAYK
jgi:hypothetical protein